MNDGDVDPFYRSFGKLVRLHRQRLPKLTQEKLGLMVGLSRTSVTNVEKGRQHVALHQVFALAEALRVKPEALLPSSGERAGPSWVAQKLPPDTDRETAEWVEKVAGE